MEGLNITILLWNKLIEWLSLNRFPSLGREEVEAIIDRSFIESRLFYDEDTQEVRLIIEDVSGHKEEIKLKVEWNIQLSEAGAGD